MTDDPWAEFSPVDPWAEFAQRNPAQPSAGQIIKDWLPTTWPVRAAKSIFGAVTLPGDVYSGKADLNTPEDFARVQDLAMMASPVNPAARAGMPARQLAVPAPSAEELKATADKTYDAIRNMGVDYSAPAVSDMAGGVQRDLESKGILRELAPKTHAILDKLQDVPEDSVSPFTGLQAARRSFGFAGKDFTNPTEQLASGTAKEALDSFLGDPRNVAAGPGELAAGLLQEANSNYAAAKRSELLSGTLENAERRAEAVNSGKNIGNTIRARTASILEKPKQTSGFSPEELGALENVSRGSFLRNRVRDVGNLLGGGGGLGAVAAAGIGGAEAGFPGAVLAPAVGYGAKALDNYLTQRSLQSADELVRQRSPLADQLQASAPYVSYSPETRAAFLRLLGLSLEKPKQTSDENQ
jgi:hypothetical protein